MNESSLRNQSFAFAIRIVKVYQFLRAARREFTMRKQLLRSGTAVGTLVRVAQPGTVCLAVAA
jgi:four helix bundle protein